MGPTIDQLIDPVSSREAKSLLARDGFIDVYFHRPAGSVEISGGDFGRQTIQAMAMDQEICDFLSATIIDLDQKLSVDFRFVDQAQFADIRFYFDSEIDVGSGGITLGIAVPNRLDNGLFYELIFNKPQYEGNDNLLRYACLHELGHALGQEHPFDAADGDVYLSRDPAFSAIPEQTVMAYPLSYQTRLPNAYTVLDLQALSSIWGVENQFNPSPASPTVQTGTDAADWLTGTSGRDILRGLAGDDRLIGAAGADQLWGGIGANWYSSSADGETDWLLIDAEARARPLPIRRRGFARVAPAERVDQIAALGREDRIAIVSDGTVRGRLGFRRVNVNNAVYGRLRGTGIYLGSELQAVYTGADLSLRQVRDITQLMTPAAAANLV